MTPVGKAVLSPPSPLDPAVMGAVEKITGEMCSGVPVIPTMSGGYTDSRWLRNAGILPTACRVCSPIPARAACTGSTNRPACEQVYDSKEFLYRLVKALAGGK